MTAHPFDAAHAQYLTAQPRGVLATIGPNGFPQAKPVGFQLDAEQGTIEIAGYEMERSAKFRNVGREPRVAFTVDDVPDADAGAQGVRFLEIRGEAEQVRLDAPGAEGLDRWIIRIHPRRMVSYNVAGPGLRSVDVPTTETAAARPAVGQDGPVPRSAQEAVERQVAELQSGLDDGDAEIYNRHFADDVMWGSPFGATVDGYDALHAIHTRLHRAGAAGRSRYAVRRVLPLSPDVVVAQVRRDALDDTGEPIRSHTGEPRYSEMIMYVLVRRNGAWWLAAGQNTIVDAGRGAVRQ